jgi:FkbM family methyltransferase
MVKFRADQVRKVLKNLQVFMKRILVTRMNSITLHLVTLGFRHKYKKPLIRLGSDYGGWWVPGHVLAKDLRNRNLISVGLGHDVTFDSEMLLKGFNLIGLDPLVSSINYAKKELAAFSQKNLLCSGLWSSSGNIEFYAPKIASHDSWSITNSQYSSREETQSYSVMTISDLYNQFPILSKSEFTILKMDIEGAEVSILFDLDFETFRIDYLASEIDYLSVIPFKNILERINKVLVVRRLLSRLEDSGYKLIHTEKFNFFWVLES